MNNYVTHKEKAKQELKLLVKKIKTNQILTDQTVDNHLETAITHIYKFILGKLQYKDSFFNNKDIK